MSLPVEGDPAFEGEIDDNSLISTSAAGSVQDEVLEKRSIAHSTHNQAQHRTKAKRNRANPDLIHQDDASFDSEPLIDTTAALTLHSKKTARMQKRVQRKEAKKVHSDVKSFLDLPHELLLQVLSFVEPSDIFNLAQVNRATNQVVTEGESSIAQSIISRRYWVLSRCFRRPFDLADVPKDALPALLSRQWQDRLRIHKNPYQHIRQIDPTRVCTCMSCVLAWNNLNIILDLGHWQTNLENREPLPIIARGKRPDWNEELLSQHADIVLKAMHSPLTYARILQIHLKTTSRTILRSSRWRKKGEKPNPNKPRLYHMTDAELESGSDEYLEKSGPPSYQPLFMRDNYYNVEAFIPNRKWDKDQQRWMYYSNWPLPHENDLMWVMQRFTPQSAD